MPSLPSSDWDVHFRWPAPHRNDPLPRYIMPTGFWPEIEKDRPDIQHRDSRGKPISLQRISIIERYTEDGEPR